jgi:protein-disulfide isomerase-like protein with CxxC motif
MREKKPLQRIVVFTTAYGNPAVILDNREHAERVLRSESLKAQYKAECKKAGRKYRRQDWIDKVAEQYGLDPEAFTNAVNRSSQRRRKKLRAKLSATVPSNLRNR